MPFCWRHVGFLGSVCTSPQAVGDTAVGPVAPLDGSWSVSDTELALQATFDISPLLDKGVSPYHLFLVFEIPDELVVQLIHL